MNNMDLQRIVLGTVLTYPDYAPSVLPELTDEMFSVELQPIFNACTGYWELSGDIDFPTMLAKYPEQREQFQAVLMAFGNDAVNPTPDRVADWVKAIKDDYTVRRAQNLAMEMTSPAMTVDGLLDCFQQLGDILTGEGNRVPRTTMSEMVDGYIRQFDKNPEYIETGLPTLDKGLKLKKGNYLVIGGRPSSGKTALSLQLAIGMAKKGIKVCYFSLETDTDTLARRIIANQLYAPLGVVKGNSLNPNELDRLTPLKKLSFVAYPAAGHSVAWMQAQAKRERAQVVFIDYLQIVNEPKNGDRYELVTDISVKLHTFAQRTGTLVVALAQLNREAAKAKPTNADLRESGQIEQDADAIILLAAGTSEDDYYFAVTKNKEGETSQLPIRFDKRIQRFMDVVGA